MDKLDIERLNGEVGSRLRAARKAARLTMEQVATRLDISKGTIGHWETGRNGIGAAELALLARIYGVPVERLFPGQEDGAPAADRAFVHAYASLDEAGRRAMRAYLAYFVRDGVSDEQVARYLPPAPPSR